GFNKAHVLMEVVIRQLCARSIGGDHQRIEVVQTQHVGVSFKHILLPIWLAAYRYRDQAYRILVNARNGKVAGTRPYSFIKIALLVLAILAVIGAIIALVALSQGSRVQAPRFGEMRHERLHASLPDRLPRGAVEHVPRRVVEWPKRGGDPCALLTSTVS